MPKHLNPLVPRVLVKQLAVCPYYVFFIRSKMLGCYNEKLVHDRFQKKRGKHVFADSAALWEKYQSISKPKSHKAKSKVPEIQFLYVPSMRSEKTDGKNCESFVYVHLMADRRKPLNPKPQNPNSILISLFCMCFWMCLMKKRKKQPKPLWKIATPRSYNVPSHVFGLLGHWSLVYNHVKKWNQAHHILSCVRFCTHRVYLAWYMVPL